MDQQGTAFIIAFHETWRQVCGGLEMFYLSWWRWSVHGSYQKEYTLGHSHTMFMNDQCVRWVKYIIRIGR